MKWVLLCPRCTVGTATLLAITAEILHKVHSYLHDVHLWKYKNIIWERGVFISVFFPDLVMKERLACTTWTNGNFQTCGLASCIPDLVQLYPKSPFDICSRIQQQQKLWGWICCWIKGVVFIFDQFPEKQISEEKTWTPWHGNLFRGTPSTPLRTWCIQIHRFAHLWQFSSSCRTMSTSNLEVKLDGVVTKQMWGFNNLYLKQWSFWVHLSIISEI